MNETIALIDPAGDSEQPHTVPGPEVDHFVVIGYGPEVDHLGVV